MAFHDRDNGLTNTNRSGQLTSVRGYDRAGRLSEYASYSTPGVLKDRQLSYYNPNGWVTLQESRNGANVVVQRVRYDQADSYDKMGHLMKYTIDVLQGTPYSNYYTQTYVKYDHYKELEIQGSSTYFQAGVNRFNYDINGNLINITDHFQANKSRDFIVNTLGQTLQKREDGKTQYYYYANNNIVGSVGEISNESFDYNYTPVSEQYPAISPGNYVVNQGDTLRGIALAAYGDAKLWYLIADANGLASDADLKAGQTLVIPNKVTNLYNDSTVFKSGGLGQIIGDVTPTLPEPPPVFVWRDSGYYNKKLRRYHLSHAIGTGDPWTVWRADRYGGTEKGVEFFNIASIIITIIVSIFSFGTLTAFFLALARQIEANKAGLQDGADLDTLFSAFATSVIGGILGGITGGNGGSSFGVPGTGSAVTQAVINNVVSQGVNIFMGEQEKFSWNSLVADWLKGYLKDHMQPAPGTRDGFGATFAKSLFTNVVNQGARVLLDGEGKMDFVSIAADAFGNAIGNSLVGTSAGQRVNNWLSKSPLGSTPMRMQYSSTGVPATPLIYADAPAYTGNMSNIDLLLFGNDGPPPPGGVMPPLDPFWVSGPAGDDTTPQQFVGRIRDQVRFGGSISPEDYMVLRSILRDHGYAIDRNQNFGFFDADSTVGGTEELSMDDFLSRTEAENNARLKFNANTGLFSKYNTPAGATHARHSSVTWDGRTVDFNFTETSTDLARGAGIDTDRALLNLTDHRVYEAAANAAFGVNGVNGLVIEGAYRPGTGPHGITNGATGGRSLDIIYLDTDGGRLPFRDDVHNKLYYDGKNPSGARYNYKTGALPSTLDGTPSVSWDANDPRALFTNNLYGQRHVNQILGPHQSSVRGRQFDPLAPSTILDVPSRPLNERKDTFRNNEKFINHRNHLHFTVQAQRY